MTNKTSETGFVGPDFSQTANQSFNRGVGQGANPDQFKSNAPYDKTPTNWGNLAPSKTSGQRAPHESSEEQDRAKALQAIETKSKIQSIKSKLSGPARNVFEGLSRSGVPESEAARLTHLAQLHLGGKQLSQLGLSRGVRPVKAFVDFLIAVHNNSAIELPSQAPAIWADRKARLPNESPIEFLHRVWGPWIEAGVLFQDHIKRLGDDKLVQAIRSYCQKHPEFTASEVLPPSRRERLDRALADVPPDSVAARLIKRKMRDREALKRKRRGSPRP